MDFLLDPNVAYVVMVTGIMLVLMALLTPGTGMFEVGALFCLVLAGYAAYNLEINGWATIPLILAVVPFLYALKFKRFRAPLMAGSIVLVIGGSVFLFKGAEGSWIGVHPLVAGVVSVISGGILWISADQVMTALSAPVAHNPGALVGKVGEARTEIKDDGTVQIDGELWSARSEKPIAPGKAVRVIQLDGFTLIVESIIP